LSTFQEIIKGETPVLVDFHAEWCKPCKIMQPILKDLKTDLGEKIKILKINVDNNSAISKKFNVNGVPTFIIFFKGKLIWRKSGLVEKEFLKTFVESLI
tara:strand:+ start:169 stop:465 length:297 start_codon:yes stop_codon:yes gene_type:complete